MAETYLFRGRPHCRISGLGVAHLKANAGNTLAYVRLGIVLEDGLTQEGVSATGRYYDGEGKTRERGHADNASVITVLAMLNDTCRNLSREANVKHAHFNFDGKEVEVGIEFHARRNVGQAFLSSVADLFEESFAAVSAAVA
ncbi:MAG: hypothetical protein WC080_00120 [Patescibacteria group bacterium]|jgi:hypothetical protein